MLPQKYHFLVTKHFFVVFEHDKFSFVSPPKLTFYLQNCNIFGGYECWLPKSDSVHGYQQLLHNLHLKALKHQFATFS